MGDVKPMSDAEVIATVMALRLERHGIAVTPRICQHLVAVVGELLAVEVIEYTVPRRDRV